MSNSHVLGLCRTWLAALVIGTGCSEPQCPHGYEKRGNTCYRIRDAGPDSATSAETGSDGGLEDATASISRGDAQADGSEVGLDAGQDPCAVCDETSRCFRSGADVMCVCETGYLKEGDRCIPDVSCAALKCDRHAVCLEDGDERKCDCLPGFRGDGQSCSDIDECAVSNGGCPADAICTDTEGGHRCACRPGFVDVRGDGSECKGGIVNECASPNVCTPEYPCQDLEMLYTCRGQFAEAPPVDAPNYLRALNGTVVDSRTGLVWSVNVPDCDDGSCTWEVAKTRCSSAGVGWRLPTRAELQSIVDYPRYRTDGICIDRTLFPNTPGGHFWTSSSDPEDATKAWVIQFDRGSSVSVAKTMGANYRCVR